MRRSAWMLAVLGLAAGFAGLPVEAVAQAGTTTGGETADPAQTAIFLVNNTWMMVATFLVFIMHLGFATLESGLTRAKNTVNILFKNTGIISIGLLTYCLWGFNAIIKGARSGTIGDGKILVQEPADCVRIRTGERGSQAIG